MSLIRQRLRGPSRGAGRAAAVAALLGAPGVGRDLGGAPCRAATPPPVEGARGAVAADHELASRAGAEILAQGGNAVDAAVATALALGVVQPSASGLGGGGFLVVRLAAGPVKVLDFRETAPARAHRDMFLDAKTGEPVPDRSRSGGLAVGVPGEPAGLAEALRKLGTMTAAQVSAPAQRLAAEGFPAGRHLIRTVGWMMDRVPAGNPVRDLIAPGGTPLVAGQRVVRPALAGTLARLGREGLDSFYKDAPGSIGREVAGAVQAAGGVLSVADLRGYRPLWREPLAGSFRGWRVYTVPPPGGGLTTLEALQVVGARPPLTEGPGASATFHVLAEAFKHAFADRMRLLSDPAFVKVPIAELASPAYAQGLAARILPDRVLPSDRYGRSGPPGAPPRDKGTTHLCVIDGAGNAAALTTTVNLPFGAKVVAGSTGILLNNQMDDFSAKPGTSNAFGLVGSEANAVAPGKRPLSSMSPLIAVAEDGTVLCAGGSGGPTIVTGTVQAVVNVIEFKMDAQAAVASPRIHAQYQPDMVIVEREVPADVQEGLRRRGHPLKIASGPGEGAVQVVVRRKGPDGPLVSGGADPRKMGVAAAP